MNKYIFKVKLCDGCYCDGNLSITEENEDLAYDAALDYLCEKLADALPELGIEISVELADVVEME